MSFNVAVRGRGREDGSRGTVQSSDDAQHYGALLEMYCCELLLAHDFRVEVQTCPKNPVQSQS